MKKVLLAILLISLSGCSGIWLGEKEQDATLEGDRIDIIPVSSMSNDLLEDKILLDSSNLSINKMKKVWSTKNIASSFPPVIDGEFIYTFNNRNIISCLDLKTGRRKWQVSIARKKEDIRGISGGGLIIGSESLLISTGFGDLFSLDKGNGGLVWKYSSFAPFTSAPYLQDGVVIAVNKENETIALSEEDGEILWKQKGTPEDASVLAKLQITGNEDIIVPTYNSGEVFALNPQTGREIWSDSLGLIYKNEIINAISNISASSVIAGDVLIATGLDNQTVAIDLGTGSRVWQNKIKSVKTPVVIGDYIYMFTKNNELLAISTIKGGVYWKKDLKSLYKDGSEVNWSDMSIYKNHIVINSSMQDILFISATDGSVSYKKDISSFSDSPPVIEGGILYMLERSDKLTAYKLY